MFKKSSKLAVFVLNLLGAQDYILTPIQIVRYDLILIKYYNRVYAGGNSENSSVNIY